LAATRLRHSEQIIKVFECKIVEKRLNKKQREELEMQFVEGKWLYNHILSMKKAGTKLRDINTTMLTEVKKFDKDKNEVIVPLKYLKS